MSEFSREMYGFAAVVQRELSATLKTRRFIVLGVIFILFAVVGAYYGNLDLGRSMSPASGSPDPKLHPVNYCISVVYSYSDIFLSILGLGLSFDAITNERTLRTLVQVLVRPVRRSTLLLGKFSAYVMAAGGLFVITTLVLFGALSIFTNRYPSINDFELLLLSMVVLMLYLASFVSLGILISSLTRTNLDSMLGAVFIWVLLLAFAYAGVITGVSAVPTNLSATTDLPYSQFPIYSKVFLWLNPGSHNVAVQSLAGDFSKMTAGLSYVDNIIFLIAIVIVTVLAAYYVFNRADIV
ncbi:MAG TPA: ABC transporter permease subunit [Candidatus Acidoferrales bacterium]|nr:ABC transporter permease subunit [Candidatus Acidoferrales bacterium]